MSYFEVAKEAVYLRALLKSMGQTQHGPTRIYTEPIRRLLAYYRVKRVVTGLAHVTGGGLPENVARILPPDCDATIDTEAWSVPAVFDVLANCGVDRREMYRVFNMGIGYVVAIRPAFANGARRVLRRAGEKPMTIGRITSGRGRVVLK